MAHESRTDDSERPSEEHGSESSLLGRRSYLKLGTAAASALALGTSATASVAADRETAEFDRTLDAVGDLGMDPSGEEPIDEALTTAFADGTLLQFPPGRYRLERDHRATGLRDFGISGLGAASDDVEFITPAGAGHKNLDFVDSRNILVENVSFRSAAGSALADSGPADGNLVVTSVAELQAVARQADAGAEPWASAKRQVLAAAEDSVDADPVAYDRSNGRALAEAARDHIRHTALAYALTGEERFAEAAVEHVHAFLVDPETRYDPDYPVIPHARIINSLVVPGVLFGASVVKNHPHWAAFGGEEQVQQWCRTYLRTCREYSRDRWGDEDKLYKYSSNRYTYRLSDRMSNAVYLRDDGEWNDAMRIWENVHNAKYTFDTGANLIVDAEGAPNGRSRAEGWEYALFDLDALVACAEIAHQRGVDLYNWQDTPAEEDIQFDGHKGERQEPLVRRTFEWFNNVFRNPEEFDGRLDAGVHPPNIGHTGRGLTAYEYGASRYDDALGDEIRAVLSEFFDRPDRNRKYTGFPTLTHGDLSGLDVGDGGGSDGGSDDGSTEHTLAVGEATSVTDVEVRVPSGGTVAVDTSTLSTDVSRTHNDERGALARVEPGDTVEMTLSGVDSLQNLSVRRGDVSLAVDGEAVVQSDVPPLDTPSWTVEGAVPALPDDGSGDDGDGGSGDDGSSSDGGGETADTFPIPDVGEPTFDRVLDAVMDLGIDDTGERPIGDELRWLDDGTLVEFPPGEYTIEAQTALYGKERVGLRAADGATFRASADSSTDGVTTTMWFNDCRDVLLDNLTFDQGGFEDDVPNVGLVANVRDGLLVRDLTIDGANDLRGDGDMVGLTVNVLDPDGEAVVEGYRHVGPSDFGEVANDAYSWAPAAVRGNHEGHVHFVECHIEGGHGGGAVFSGKHAGTTGFDRCYLVNNNVAGPRLGAGVVRDSTIYVNWQRSHPGSRTVEDYSSTTNGIYLSSSPTTGTETLVENNDIWLHTQPYPEDFGERKWEDGAAIVVDPSNGGVTVRNNRIRMDTRQRLVYAVDGSEPRWRGGEIPPEDQRWVRVEDNDLTGMGRGEELVRLDNRPGSVVANNRYDDAAADPDVSPPFATATPPRRDLEGDPRSGWGVELSSPLTREQLVANVPDAYRERIEAADLFAPYNAAESRENDDALVAGEGGLHTLRVVDDGTDVVYDLDVQSSDDTAGVRYGMIHHGPRGMSDNRHSMWTIPDDGTRQPPLRYSSRFSDSRIDNEDAALLDGANVDAGNLAEYVDYLVANPREFYSNVHTTTYETEAVRGQLRPADFAKLSRAELLETVLATAGPAGLQEALDETPTDTVSITGTVDGAVEYTVTVDGTVEPNPDKGTFDWGDSAEDGVASGTVGNGGTDSYLFSGSITDVTLSDEAAVFINGQQVDPDSLGEEDPTLPNEMYVDGTGASGRCDYEFAVSGSVARAPELARTEADDTVGDGTVSGSVTDDVDAYRFSGTVKRMRMDGSARVRFGDLD